MTPDVKNQISSSVMNYDSRNARTSSVSSSDFESSYSEVEVSIESNRAMTEDESSSSSSSENEESSEDSRAHMVGQYKELIEDDDDETDDTTEILKGGDQVDDGGRGGQGYHESWRKPLPDDLFALRRQQLANRMFSSSSATTAPTTKIRRTKASPEDQETNESQKPSSDRRKKPPSDDLPNDDKPVSSNSLVPAESDDIANSSDSKSEKKQAILAAASNNNPSNNYNSNNQNKNHPQHHAKQSPHANHRSIKIPALHNNKQQGDDDYIKRQIKQENNRRSRSLSRSENSGSGHNNNNSSNNNNNHQRKNSRPRKTRSRSSGRQPSSDQQQQQQQQQQQSQQESQLENSLQGSSSSNSNNSSNSNSHHVHRTSSMAKNTTPAPRRLASIHTSTPSNQLTGSTSKNSISSKHSNYDGSKRVSWKSDPKASFSDWTLHVVYKDSNHKRRIDVYHVHRNVVGFGNRKSNYLLKDIMENELQELLIDSSSRTEVELRELLNSKNNNTANNNNKKKAGSGAHAKTGSDTKKKELSITRLKLPTESQARSVPMVLDFMYYTNETKQRMSADRSCNVFKVAEGLEVQALQKAIGEFYMKNLSLKNLGEFLTAATKVKADKLLTICKAKIGQMITVKPELSAMVPPKFMAEILSISSKQLLEARKKEPKKYPNDLMISQSRYWSKAACICASKNEAILTQKLFGKLTSEESLPYIDVSATPRLLAMESTFLEGSRTSGGRKPNQLTSLQRRCVESIGEDFDAFQECFDSHQEIAESLKHLPSTILSEILMKLLTRP